MNAKQRQILDLLADRATEGLDASGAARLSQLLAVHGDVDAQSLDRTAAMIDAALAPRAHGELPERLRARILARASDALGSRDNADESR